MIRFFLFMCTFAAGAGAGYGGPILYRTYYPEVVATVAPMVQQPMIHPARPVSWWKAHQTPELGKMIPWCRDHDPGGKQYQDCRNAEEALMQLQIEAVTAKR